MSTIEDNGAQEISRTRGLQGWAAAWRRRRSRLIADPAFQRWTARLPLIRLIVARKERALFNLAAGFVYSQVLYALIEAGVLPMLLEGPKSSEDIASQTGLPAANVQALLRAGCEIELIAEADNSWLLSDLGAVVVSNDGIRAMVRHHAMLYSDLADPMALLHNRKTETKTARFWSYAGGTDADSVTTEEAEAYSGLMSMSQDLIIEEVLAAYSLSGHKQILDVGGGEGRFLGAAAERYPNLQLRLFDLPAVAERARSTFAQSAASERFEVIAGDFFNDEIPPGSDLISLIRILCDHDDGPALALLRRIRATMEPGHRLLIAEPMGGRQGRAGGAAAYFSFYFLAMQSGRSRTPGEIKNMLDEAGFRGSRFVRCRQPLLTSVIIAEA
ncbi:MAG: methyltransferase [Pseudomonadota bacterium]